MKLGKVIALMLVLLPFSMGAQEVDQSVEKRIDSLATEVTTLDKVVQKLSKFNVSAYIQGQYQYGQEDATLKVGDKNENLDKGFNRIGIRRGRMKFEYNDGIGTGAVQIEVNDKGVSFRDLYIGIKDPWTKRSQLMAGVFNRPFGYESVIPRVLSNLRRERLLSSISSRMSVTLERCLPYVPRLPAIEFLAIGCRSVCRKQYQPGDG